MEVDIAEFVARLVDRSLAFEAHSIRSGAGALLPVRVLSMPKGDPRGKPLVLAFHGAVVRSRQQIPVFDGQFAQAALNNKATLIGIADPNLEVSPRVSVGWYTNTRHRRTAEEIRAILDELIAALQPSRVVFFGGSIGGHGALYQSFHVKGSVCVVKNPIACISLYFPMQVRQYRELLWPGLDKAEPLPLDACDEVASIYERGHDNNIIYLQNTTDHHVPTQMVRFLARFPYSDKIMLICQYCGRYGGHSFNPRDVVRWLSAAAFSASPLPADIAAVAQPDLPPGQPDRSTTSTRHDNRKSYDARDIEVANALASHLLRA